ncbi:hypothetical protein TKK_0009423 [Trichogramma kaykai]
MTEGIFESLGTTCMEFQQFSCIVHVITDSFPIDTHGLIGWPTIKDNKGKIDAESNHLEINGYKIPFTGMEILEIPPRTRHVIYAYVSNTEQQVGMVPNMHEGLLFGNFLSVNREGRVYAIAINTTSEIIKLRPPTVQLLPVKEINDSDSSKRVKKIFELLDPKTLEHLNDEEIQHIKDLISESPYTFELPGEPLKPTNVITHKIETTSDIPDSPQQSSGISSARLVKSICSLYRCLRLCRWLHFSKRHVYS